MKKITKPLALHRETIRALATDELGGAAGGSNDETGIFTSFCRTVMCPPRTNTTTCPQ